VPYLRALEVCSRQGAIQIHVYLTISNRLSVTHKYVARTDRQTFEQQMPRLTTPRGQKLLSAMHYLVVRKACVCQYNDSLNISIYWLPTILRNLFDIFDPLFYSLRTTKLHHMTDIGECLRVPVCLSAANAVEAMWC